MTASIAGTPVAVAGGTTISVPTDTVLPSGILGTEHVLAAFMWGNSSVTFTPPAGFTQVRASTAIQPNLWVGIGTVRGAPANTGAAISSSTRWAWIAVRIANEDPSTPIDASAISVAAAAVTTSITGVTTTATQANDLLLHVHALYGTDITGATNTWTPDAATTLVASSQSTSATARNAMIMMASEAKATAGTTTARVAAITQAGDAQSVVIAIAPVAVAGGQVLTPATDITTAGWVVTGGTGTFASALDENVADDADYITSPANPTGAVFETKVTSGSDPVSSVSHSFDYRVRVQSAGTYSVTVGLYQGATLIASVVRTTGLTTAYQSFTLTLSGAQADAITDYADLRLRATVTAA